MNNLAIIGAGRMAKTHVDKLQELSQAKLYGVFDTVAETAKTFAEKYNMEKIYASEAELAADPGIDAVLVCNYTDQHYQTLKNLLAAGKKYIFCEKALVRKLADGEDLLKRAEAAKAAIMVGHHRRYISGYARLNDLIHSGELGKIRMAKVGFCHPAYTREWGDFFADFERCGGVILDMMTHLFDQLNWYFGEPESVSGNSVMFDRSQPLPMDYVSGTVTYRNGVICNIDGSWQRYGVGYDKMEVYGDKACSIYEQGDKLHVYRKDEHTEIKVGNPPVYGEQMKAFVDMLENGTAPRTGLVDGFNSVRIALKMIEAVKTRQTLHF
ncbi:MAG: Gfo/Idh/MocA family oxidoreductase [Victivallales bacterium]|nr:Gfo/Idh/MocA family oxidoreductase [Victivallales bacterium]